MPDAPYTPRGAPTFTTGQATIATSATVIAAQRTKRHRIVVVVPDGGATVYVGASNVATSTGVPVEAGKSVGFQTEGALYGIVAAGTQAVGYWEEHE